MEVKKYNEEIKELTERVSTLADESRLKMSLAKMEARDTWHSIEKSLLKIVSELKILKTKASQEIDHIKLEWHLAVMELGDRISYISEQLRPLFDDLKGVKTQIDHARVQAHLAKLELKDEVDEKISKLEKTYKTEVIPAVKDTVEQVKTKVHEIEEKFKDK